MVTGLGKPETDPPREDGGGHRMSTAIITQIKAKVQPN
jgi:hypothetical protein